MAAAHCIVQEPSLPTILSKFSRHLFAKVGLGDVTVGNYLGCIKRLAPILGLNPTLEAIEDHIAAMRKAGASYSHQTNTAVALERYMAFLEHPIKLCRPKKPKRLIRGTLSEAEVTIWIHAANSLREKTILSLLAFSGVRPKELCTLAIGDVDVVNQWIAVRNGKGDVDRNAPIAPACVGLILEYLIDRHGQPGERLFVTLRHHTNYHQQDLRKLVRETAQRVGIERRVWPYLLRHSLATNMLHRGAHVIAIKDQLGHAEIETTMIYVHSDAARMQLQYKMYAPSYM
jgi:site-specific recombinase XerD